VAKTLTFIPIFDRGNFTLPIMFVGWSLAYELAFYGAVALLLLSRVRTPLPLVLAALVLGLASTFGPFVSLHSNFWLNPLWWEFGAGVATAMMWQRLNRYPAVIGGLLLVLGFALWIASAGPFSLRLADCLRVLDNSASWSRAVRWGLSAWAVVMGTLILAARPRAPRVPAWLVTVGDSSYAWYLTQLLSLPLIARVWRMGGIGPSALAFLVVALTGSALFAIFATRWVEQPLYRACLALRRGRPSRQQASLAATARAS
jgi:peptidoglycan/LPS O-acetylase OafA/YrhL